jgi:hypothetical protein
MPQTRPSYVTESGLYDLLKGLGSETVSYLISKDHVFRRRAANYSNNSEQWLVSRSHYQRLKRTIRGFRIEDERQSSSSKKKSNGHPSIQHVTGPENKLPPSTAVDA